MSCPPVHLERCFITAHLNYKLDIISFSSQCFLPLCSGRWLGFLDILWVLSEMLNPGVDFIGALCSVHDYLMFPLYTGLQSYMFQSPKSVLPLVLEQHHPEVSKSLNPVQVFLESFILFSYFLPCVLPPLLPPNPNNSALCLVQTKPFTEIFSLFFFALTSPYCQGIVFSSSTCFPFHRTWPGCYRIARVYSARAKLLYTDFSCTFGIHSIPPQNIGLCNLITGLKIEAWPDS